MKFGGISAFALAILAGSAVQAAPPASPAPVVFFDIASSDLASEATFYRTVFNWDVGPGGMLQVPVASPLAGNLRVEAAGHGPVAERVIYIGVPDVTAALASVVTHGGSIVFPRMVYPGVVVVGMFKDPAGNRMGLVEMSGGKPIVPPAH